MTVDKLITDITASRPSLAHDLRGAIAFLLDMRIVESQKHNTVRLCTEVAGIKAKSGMSDIISRKILSRLMIDGTLEQIASGLQCEEGDESLVIDSRFFPWRYRSLRNIFLWLGVFKRESLDQRHWTIPTEYNSFFMNAARQANLFKFHVKGSTPEDIAGDTEKNVLEGSLAEEWVLAREHDRLVGHPLIDLVARISEQNSEAGYDILSFSTVRSHFHDRFIEVKSYSSRRHFYWTGREVEIAKNLGSKYYLYIIDRERMGDSSYKPEIIKGPYGYFFEHQPDGWTYNPSTYHFEFSH